SSDLSCVGSIHGSTGLLLLLLLLLHLLLLLLLLFLFLLRFERWRILQLFSGYIDSSGTCFGVDITHFGPGNADALFADAEETANTDYDTFQLTLIIENEIIDSAYVFCIVAGSVLQRNTHDG